MLEKHILNELDDYLVEFEDNCWNCMNDC